MKKTIIITISMLCVFGAVVMFGADRVSNDWQQPQQDDKIDISIESPIENMESEIKKYPYKANDESELEKGDVSYQEAVYTAGVVLEQIYENLSTDQHHRLSDDGLCGTDSKRQSHSHRRRRQKSMAGAVSCVEYGRS